MIGLSANLRIIKFGHVPRSVASITSILLLIKLIFAIVSQNCFMVGGILVKPQPDAVSVWNDIGRATGATAKDDMLVLPEIYKKIKK